MGWEMALGEELPGSPVAKGLVLAGCVVGRLMTAEFVAEPGDPERAEVDRTEPSVVRTISSPGAAVEPGGTRGRNVRRIYQMCSKERLTGRAKVIERSPISVPPLTVSSWFLTRPEELCRQKLENPNR
jgi:hypothetical protein